MKKFIVGAIALAIGAIGFGTLGAPAAHADPANIWVINDNVKSALVADCDPGTPGNQSCDLTDTAIGGDLDKLLSGSLGVTLDDLDAATDGQVSVNVANGTVYIIVRTDGSNTDVTLNGKGLTCNPLCDGDVANAQTPTNRWIVYEVTGEGSRTRGDSFNVTVTQDGVTLDHPVTIVGSPRGLDLVVVKTTIQEGLTSCAITDSTDHPSRTGALAVAKDVDGTALVGVPVTWSSSAAAKLLSALSSGMTMLLESVPGTPVGSGNVLCGRSAGTADIRVSGAAAVFGEAITRSETITITGVPAEISLSASPAAIACDGVNTSTVTATVTDSEGNNVADGVEVRFDVVALGTANPIRAKTADGQASSTITPLSGAVAGVTVVVTAGDAEASIRIDCIQPTPTAPPASPTPTGPITPPVTGNGGYLSQNAAGGFSWIALAGLALGALALTLGGAAVRKVSR